MAIFEGFGGAVTQRVLEWHFFGGLGVGCDAEGARMAIFVGFGGAVTQRVLECQFVGGFGVDCDAEVGITPADVVPPACIRAPSVVVGR